MKPKQLLTLIVIGAVLGGLAWFTSRDHDEAPTLLGTRVLADLDLNAINEVVISSGDATCKVVRNESGWVMPSRYDFPADFSKLRNLLLTLDKLEIGQIATLNDQQKSQLGFDEEDVTRVALYADGAKKAELLLGDQRQQESGAGGPQGMGRFPDGRYISADGGETVYLVSGTISEASTAPEGWLNTEILNIPGSDIQSVQVKPAEGDAYEVLRNEEGKLEMAELKEGEEFDSSKSYAIENVLSYLNLKDVADPAASDAELGFDKTCQLKATTKDGREFTVSVSAPIEDSDDRYIRVSATYNQPAPPPEATADEEGSDEAKAAAVAKAAEAATAKAEVEELNARLADWTFRIQGYKADALCKPRAELLKEKEPEEAPKAEEAPAPEAAPEAEAEETPTVTEPTEMPESTSETTEEDDAS